MIRRFAAGFASTALVCGGLALAAPAAGAATFDVTSGADDGTPGTFRWAVEQAAANPGDDVVNVAPAVTAITLTDCVAGRVLNAPSGSLTINGNGATVTQTCPDGVYGGVGDTTINNLTLTGGNTLGNGGAIELNGGLTLDGVTITGNTAGGDGGGIFTVGATIRDSVISNNTALGDGAGVYLFGAGTVTVSSSTVRTNTATGAGGGIFADGTIELVETEVLENAATTGAGLISKFDVSINDSTVSRNSAAADGGGAMSLGVMTVAGSTVADNDAVNSFGGIFGGTVVAVVESTVAGNDAGGIAGGVYGGEVSILSSAITGNTAVSTGGGVAAVTSLTVDNTTIANNVATVGGGIASVGTADLSFATIVGNGSTNLTVSGPTSIFGSVVALSAQDCALSGGGTIVSGGYNFGGDASCGFTAPGDMNAAGDPMLSELALNDGSTENSLPVSGSPLLNTIPSADARCAGVDQRGFARPANGACDTGATEIRQVSALSSAVSTPYQTAVVTDLVPLVTDPDSVLTEYEVQGAQHGTLDAAPGGLVTYTPSSGFSGTDSYTYTVCSTGNVICAATQTITVTVGPGPAPVAAATPVAVTPRFTG